MLEDLSKSEFIDLMMMYSDLLGLGLDGNVYHIRNEITSKPLTVMHSINENEVLVTEPSGIPSSSIFTLGTRRKGGNIVIYEQVILSDAFCVELWNNDITIIHAGKDGRVSPYNKEEIITRFNRLETIKNIVNNQE